MFVDVTFPLKLHPLTYQLPDNLENEDLLGSIVNVSLGKKKCFGIITSVNTPPPDFLKSIKPIEQIFCKIGNLNYLSFFYWLCQYYFTPLGITLKAMIFEDIVEALKSIAFKPLHHTAPSSHSYKAFLAHHALFQYEIDDIVRQISNITTHGCKIILTPDITSFNKTYLAVEKNFSNKHIAIFHSKMTKKQKIHNIIKILLNEAEIIVGVRSAILLPYAKIDFIAVASEHSPSYKADGLLRYHCRDTAVMRAFIEKCCVYLTSTIPSVESYFNVKKKKYILVPPDTSHNKRPTIKILQHTNTNTAVSKYILKEVAKTYKQNGSCLFIINRKGYSLLKCVDCGKLISCKKCDMPYVFSKENSKYICNVCNDETTVFDACPYCHGISLQTWGTGIERVKSELHEAFASEVKLLSKGVKNSELEPNKKLCVGTNYALRKGLRDKFDIAVAVNIDLHMKFADFRAYEKVFQDIIGIVDLVNPNGFIYIQTFYCELPIWRFIKEYDFEAFYKNELQQRQTLQYPPFSKMALISIKGSLLIFDKIIQRLKKLQMHKMSAEILGPLLKSTSQMTNDAIYQILIKSRESKTLHETVQKIIDTLNETKEIDITVDMDPINV